MSFLIHAHLQIQGYLDQETVKARRRRHTSNRRRRSVLAKDLALSGSNIREESPDRFDPQARRHPNLFAQGPPSRSRAETRIEADEEDEEDNDDQACGSFFGSNLWSML